MILLRVSGFDGIYIESKELKDKILFNHCSGGETVKDVQLPWIIEILLAHSVGNIIVEDSESVKQLNKG